METGQACVKKKPPPHGPQATPSARHRQIIARKSALQLDFTHEPSICPGDLEHLRMPVGDVFPAGDGLVADDSGVERAAGGIALLVVSPSRGAALNLAKALMSQPPDTHLKAGRHSERFTAGEQVPGHLLARSGHFVASSRLIQREGSGEPSFTAGFWECPPRADDAAPRGTPVEAWSDRQSIRYLGGWRWIGCR